MPSRLWHFPAASTRGAKPRGKFCLSTCQSVVGSSQPSSHRKHCKRTPRRSVNSRPNVSITARHSASVIRWPGQETSYQEL